MSEMSIVFPPEYTADEQNLVRFQLEPDEEIAWTEKPTVVLFSGDGSWFFMLMAFGIYYKAIESAMSGNFDLFYVVAVVFATILIVVPLGTKLSLRKKIYVLTNLRAFILNSRSMSLEREWRGSLLKILDVRVRGKEGELGDLILERKIIQHSKGSRTHLIGFLHIKNPREVASLIKKYEEEQCEVEVKKIAMDIIQPYAGQPVPAPTGEDEVNAMPWLSMGERLLWVGHPNIRTWTQGTGFLCFFGVIILLCIYVNRDFILNACQSSIEIASLACFGLIFSLWLSWRLLTAPRRRKNRTSKTLYILTDKHALVVKPHWLTGNPVKKHTWDLKSEFVQGIAESPYNKGGKDIIFSYNEKIIVNDKPLAEGFLDIESIEMPLAVLSSIQGLGK